MTDTAASTSLVLVRHGEAVRNRDGVLAGYRNCTGLTVRGREQATRLAELLAAQQQREPVAVLYSTKVARTVETADILGERLGLAVRAEFEPCHYGAADSRTVGDVIAVFGGAPSRYLHMPIAAGAEPWSAFSRRVGRELQMLSAAHPGRTVLWVCHRDTVVAAAQQFLHLHPDRDTDVDMQVDFTSRTIWQRSRPYWAGADVDLWRWTLTRHNDTRHLAGVTEETTTTW